VISDESRALEENLAKHLGVEPEDVRDYMYAVIEQRLWRGGEKRERRTGIKMIRGTHGCTYVRDPEATDMLPPGVEPPPESREVPARR
jgi:transcription initiation factor IIE alpha subunit